MDTTTKPKSVHVAGRRWFERTNGNTYHSVRVWVDGKLIGHAPFHYGYGNHYQQTAEEFLIKAGIMPAGETTHLSIWMRENDIVYVDDIVDVQRKKDL